MFLVIRGLLLAELLQLLLDPDIVLEYPRAEVLAMTMHSGFIIIFILLVVNVAFDIKPGVVPFVGDCQELPVFSFKTLYTCSHRVLRKRSQITRLLVQVLLKLLHQLLLCLRAAQRNFLISSFLQRFMIGCCMPFDRGDFFLQALSFIIQVFQNIRVVLPLPAVDGARIHIGPLTFIRYPCYLFFERFYCFNQRNWYILP